MQLARPGIEQIIPPQTETTTLAFSSVFIFLLGGAQRVKGHSVRQQELRLQCVHFLRLRPTFSLVFLKTLVLSNQFHLNYKINI